MVSYIQSLSSYSSPLMFTANVTASDLSIPVCPWVRWQLHLRAALSPFLAPKEVYQNPLPSPLHNWRTTQPRKCLLQGWTITPSCWQFPRAQKMFFREVHCWYHFRVPLTHQKPNLQRQISQLVTPLSVTCFAQDEPPIYHFTDHGTLWVSQGLFTLEINCFLWTFCHSHQNWAEYAQNSLKQSSTSLTLFQCMHGSSGIPVVWRTFRCSRCRLPVPGQWGTSHISTVGWIVLVA